MKIFKMTGSKIMEVNGKNSEYLSRDFCRDIRNIKDVGTTRESHLIFKKRVYDDPRIGNINKIDRYDDIMVLMDERSGASMAFVFDTIDYLKREYGICKKAKEILAESLAREKRSNVKLLSRIKELKCEDE